MRTNDHRGFALLLAILFVSMILSMALGITDIVIKENRLSGFAKDSETAFLAADKGIDCALFYHISYDRNAPALLWSPFPTSTVNVGYWYPQNVNTATCNGLQITSNGQTSWQVLSSNNSSARSEFWLNFGVAPNAPCARIEVENFNSGVDSTITSEGYNTCNAGDPRRTLRVIQVSTNLGG